MPKSFTLVNVERMQEGHAGTVKILPREFRERLEPEQGVKLIFLAADGRGERMWVRITEVQNGRYVGTLNNEPVVLTHLKFKDIIEFGPENIAQVWDGIECDPGIDMVDKNSLCAWKCQNCGGPLKAARSTMKKEHFVAKNVPCWKCADCGSEFFEQDTTDRCTAALVNGFKSIRFDKKGRVKELR
jgi:YgiT-type zinc finger domain-containing protein